MTAEILTFPSRGSINRREKIISGNLATSKLAKTWHIGRAGTAPPALPIIPNLTHCADARRSRIKRQPGLLPPAAKRVLCAMLAHSDTSKPIAYCLTRLSKEITRSFVSADILLFVRMDHAPNRIRELRKLAELSQEQLGEMIGAHKMTISDLERGKIELTLSYMRKIAKALNVPIDAVLPDADVPSRTTADEQQLLDAYRSAPKSARDFLLTSARAVAEQNQVEPANDRAAA